MNKFEDIVDNYSPEVIEALVRRMEEMAGLPKEEMGKRTPGEPCTYAGEKLVNGKIVRKDQI